MRFGQSFLEFELDRGINLTEPWTIVTFYEICFLNLDMRLPVFLMISQIKVLFVFMIFAEDALTRLVDGNARFVSDQHYSESYSFERQRMESVESQTPFAIILGCSDSRVPLEIVFDQGLGDLFVIRVAGNIAAYSQIGSIEYAVSKLGARLVVVLGHTRCGAILASLNEYIHTTDGLTPGIKSLISRIQPSVETVISQSDETSTNVLVDQIMKRNVEATVDTLRTESPVLAHYQQHEGLSIIGAEYSLETGWVKFYDEKES